MLKFSKTDLMRKTIIVGAITFLCMPVMNNMMSPRKFVAKNQCLPSDSYRDICSVCGSESH